MKKSIIIISAVFLALTFAINCAEAKNSISENNKPQAEQIKQKTELKNTDSGELLSNIGFHKRSEISPELQIRKIFQDYEKYTNSKDINNFAKLYDTTYRSADGYDLDRLKKLAIESWKDYPNVKYSVKILSLNIDIDNATVITNERLSGLTESGVDYIKGKGDIDSESTSVYYLQRFSNEWRIISDFIISEKTSMRFGAARYIPMRLDAPSIASPNEDYTAIIKMDVPRDYVALVSLTNEPITYPIEKSTEVFRGLKADGIRERILKTNDGTKNENAIASIAIAYPDVKNDMINISIAGIAFMSSRVNVVKHKIDTVSDLQEELATDKTTEAGSEE